MSIIAPLLRRSCVHTWVTQDDRIESLFYYVWRGRPPLIMNILYAASASARVLICGLATRTISINKMLINYKMSLCILRRWACVQSIAKKFLVKIIVWKCFLRKIHENIVWSVLSFNSLTKYYAFDRMRMHFAYTSTIFTGKISEKHVTRQINIYILNLYLDTIV